jgi:hypothetical protein
VRRALLVAAAACGGKAGDGPPLERHRVDVASPYLARLCAHARTDAAAERAGIAVVGDTLRARDRDDHVPVRWARAHGCRVADGAKPNEEVRCWVSGRFALEAYLLGDRELGLRGLPAELAVPVDRAVVLASATARTGKDRHTYWTVTVVERAVAPDDASGHVVSASQTAFPQILVAPDE